jgi:hypothetical protein
VPESNHNFPNGLPPIADVRVWEKLVPGTAQLLFDQIRKSMEHGRRMDWVKLAIDSTVRILACIIALWVAVHRNGEFAAIPAALAVIGRPGKDSFVLGKARNRNSNN